MWLAPGSWFFSSVWLIVLMADFPISIAADALFSPEKTDNFVLAIFVAGTIFWLAVGRISEFLYLTFLRIKQRHA